MDQGKKNRIGYMAISIIVMLLGLCMIIWPVSSAELICTAIGIGLLLISILVVIRYLTAQTRAMSDQIILAVGVILGVLGIILLFRPNWILTLVHVILGILILIDGIFKVIKAFDAKRFALEKWWLILLFAVLTCVFGLVIILNPFAGVSVLMTVIGVILILEGAQNFWIGLYAMKY